MLDRRPHQSVWVWGSVVFGSRYCKCNVKLPLHARLTTIRAREQSSYLRPHPSESVSHQRLVGPFFFGHEISCDSMEDTAYSVSISTLWRLYCLWDQRATVWTYSDEPRPVLIRRRCSAFGVSAKNPAKKSGCWSGSSSTMTIRRIVNSIEKQA